MNTIAKNGKFYASVNPTAYVEKSSIATTIDSSSTNEQVPSAKAVNNEINYGKEITDSIISKYGTEICKYPIGRWYIPTVEMYAKLTDFPISLTTSCTVDITSITPDKDINTETWAYRNVSLKYINATNSEIYVRAFNTGDTAGIIYDDSGWKKVCTTKVSDVALTSLTIPTTLYTSITSSISYIKYEVVNGVCTVYIAFREMLFSGNSNPFIIGTISKPRNKIQITFTGEGTADGMTIIVDENGLFQLWVNHGETTNSHNYLYTFSYPVAES